MDVSKAVEKTYNQYFGLFLSIGQRNYGLNGETIKDMIQETFEKVLKNMHKIKAKDEAGVRSYAITVFRNTCISHLRRPNPFIELGHNSIEPVCMVNDSLERTVSDKNSNPLYEILLIEEMRLQEAAINKLPEKYRETVKLSLEGVKRKDIAKLLNIKETAIHNLKYRGLKKYEKIIKTLDPMRKS